MKGGRIYDSIRAQRRAHRAVAEAMRRWAPQIGVSSEGAGERGALPFNLSGAIPLKTKEK